MHTNNFSAGRYNVIDALRGFFIINMIVYHTIWDLVYIFGFDWEWYGSYAAYVWQQYICCTFILLSGLCIPFGKQKLKRGITVFFSGALISLVTIIILPHNKIIFGILTLIGSCMLLIIPAEEKLSKINPYAGAIVSIALFAASRNITKGYLLFCELPHDLYRNNLTAYLGFPPSDFSSSDYFPLFPWMFLFISGYFLHNILERKYLLRKLKKSHSLVLEWIGQHSLMIYILHQPVIYFLLYIFLGSIRIIS